MSKIEVTYRKLYIVVFFFPEKACPCTNNKVEWERTINHMRFSQKKFPSFFFPEVHRWSIFITLQHSNLYIHHRHSTLNIEKKNKHRTNDWLKKHCLLTVRLFLILYNALEKTNELSVFDSRHSQLPNKVGNIIFSFC